MPLNELISLMSVYQHIVSDKLNLEYQDNGSIYLRFGSGYGILFDNMKDMTDYMVKQLTQRNIAWKV